jgi:signal transduction histidine kinase
MNTGNAQPRVNLEVLDLLTQVAGFLFLTENPLSQAFEMVRQTAKIHEADISTLFLVEGRSRLVLKAGVAHLDGREMALPNDIHSYKINWDVTDESEMVEQGLTAFVAAIGKSLSVESYEELLSHPSYSGKWNKAIYPKAVDDPKNGFGCLYAVPLRLHPKGAPRESVIGVFKIERRRNRPHFTEEDRKIFDLVAAHLSLILQNIYRVQNRFFNDVAHAIGGGLGRAFYLLRTCETILEHRENDPHQALNLISDSLHNAIRIMDRAYKRLNLVIEASRDPDRMTEKSISEVWEAILNEVQIKNDVKIDGSKILFKFYSPLTMETKLRLRSIAYHDLITILGNLLDNAVRHSGSPLPAMFYIISRSDASGMHLIFRVIDLGPGISRDIIKTAAATKHTEIYRLPGIASTIKGTGLRRVFGIAKHNKWDIDYRIEDGSIFEITTPDFLVEINKGEEKDD